MAGVRRRRARSPEDKAARRQAVLDEAWRLFQRLPWSGLTLLQVAEGVGLSKAALYRYFDTKETLFLAVAETQLRGWLLELGRKLDALARGASAEQLAEVLCASLNKRPAMARLLSLLHVELEHNLTPAEALRFKRALHVLLTHFGGQLARAAGLPSEELGLKAALYLHALIIGLWQMSDPPPKVAQLLQTAGLTALQVDFPSALLHGAAALLRGLVTARLPGRTTAAPRAAVR
jgi:AcrR family transcriptional regulator